MGQESHTYDKGIWALVPAGNWSEAATCWWVVACTLLAVVWADAVLMALPSAMYANEPFEATRKVPVVLSSAGVLTTLILALYHIDTKWTNDYRAPFDWWIFMPLVVAEVFTLLFVAAVGLCVASARPPCVPTKNFVAENDLSVGVKLWAQSCAACPIVCSHLQRTNPCCTRPLFTRARC